MEATAIIVEDQTIIWDYARSCLEPHYVIKACCSSTKEAESIIRDIQPNLVWLDCYLGEITDQGQGLKNSGLELAYWIKNHFPKTKIFLFTASNEIFLLQTAQRIGIEGIALGGKYIRDKQIIIDGIKSIKKGKKWLSPDIISNIKMTNFLEITVLEFSVVTSLLLGKNTAQIAEEMDLTRKHVNNALYRIKQKLNLDDTISREELLELMKNKIYEAITPSEYYGLSEMVIINTTIQNYLQPLVEKIKEGKLSKVKLKNLIEL